MVKSTQKSETETFGIVGRFHRFEDLAGKRVNVWKNGQKETELTQNRQEQAWRVKHLSTEVNGYKS